MAQAFYNQRFDSVQTLRGIAALSVILHHINRINNGSFGVDLFFVVSGFIMMYVTQISTQGFLIKRFIRIIPLYYFMTLVTVIAFFINEKLFDNTVINAEYIVKSLLFIPFSEQPIVKVGWTLNYEMLFYIILWVAMKINYNYRSIIATAIIIGVVFVTGFFEIDSSIILEFVYGMAAYHILKDIDYDKEKKAGNKRVLLLLISLFCYIFMWYEKYSYFLKGIDRFILKGIPAFILFCCFFAACYSIKIPKIFVYIGDISYSIYLIHYFITRLCNKYMADAPVIILIAVVFISTLLIASISYNVFEKKLNKWLRKKIPL